MTPEFVVGFARQAIELTLLIALPLLGVGLGVGLFVSIIQAATQIQEATLSFIPKIVSMFLALLFAFPWIMDKIVTYTREIFLNFPMYIRMGGG
ncbi:flagellar biosynthesis protein FliQ [Desulfovibrio sp. OttesenSCG-928-G11]|nr:flagellar biosynthesis protein FliQ [Desulfovibrio sp. OttesenSCG-928-G11]